MTDHRKQPDQEGERLRRYLDEIMPEPLSRKDAYDMIVEPTGAAEAHRVLDWIQAALLPAIKRLRGAEMAGTMSRSVPAADYIPTLTVDAGISDRFVFTVLVIPMDNLASFAWLQLDERHLDYAKHHHFLAEKWDLGALYEGPVGYEWRFIPPEFQGMGTDLLHDLPIATLPPLLPDNIRPFLEYIVTRCVERELAWREHRESRKDRKEGTS